MDCNFRLRNKIRGIHSDPHLSPGWAYFVNPAPYGAFVADYADDDDVCRLAVINWRDTSNIYICRSVVVLAFKPYSTC